MGASRSNLNESVTSSAFCEYLFGTDGSLFVITVSLFQLLRDKYSDNISFRDSSASIDPLWVLVSINSFERIASESIVSSTRMNPSLYTVSTVSSWLTLWFKRATGFVRFEIVKLVSSIMSSTGSSTRSLSKRRSSDDESSRGSEDETTSPTVSDVSESFDNNASIREAASSISTLLLDAIEDLMVNVFNVQSRVTRELRRVLSLIGVNRDVTALFDTVVNEDKWITATITYDKPQIESVLFGVMEYSIDCDLDRIVYTVLSSQSLLVFYNMYKHAFTPERCYQLRSTVRLLQHVNAKSELFSDSEQWRKYKSLCVSQLRVTCRLLLTVALQLTDSKKIRIYGESVAKALELGAFYVADCVNKCKSFANEAERCEAERCVTTDEYSRPRKQRR